MKLQILARCLVSMGTLLASQATFSQIGEPIEGEYIIKFKPEKQVLSSKTGPAGLKDANRFATAKGIKTLSQLQGVHVLNKFSNAGLAHVNSVKNNQYEYLRTHPDVEYIEPNRLLSLETPEKDPSFNSQGVAHDPTDTYTQSYANVQVSESWAIQKQPGSATQIVVAIIDTGLDIDHAVFKDSKAVWNNTAEINGVTGVDDDQNGFVDDFHGWNFVDRSGYMYDDGEHGTHVAGIVLGAGQDIMQVPVRESKIAIMPLKFLNGAGSGSTANAINAIYYAVENGAKIINNSWGGPSYSKSLHDAYKFAYDNNVLITTAAGNSGENLDVSPMYPAALDSPNNISVAASTSTDRRANFSNYSSTLAHVFAPGSSIISTIPGSYCNDANNIYYGCLESLSGTSMAAPFVAGLAALAWREAPQLSAYQIRGLILSSVDVVPDLSGLAETGGRVNALKITQAAQSQISTSSWQPAYSPVYKSDFRTVASVPEESAPAGGCGSVQALGSSVNGPLTLENFLSRLLLCILVLSPVLVVYRFKQASQISRPYVRQFERFDMAKNLVIQMGDQVIEAASKTLSVGGLSFESNVAFAKGQSVRVKVSEHDEYLEGQIVWSAQNNSFGVKFNQVSENFSEQMKKWTKN